MSLRSDRVLAQAMFYAVHRKNAPTEESSLASLDAFVAFRGQYDEPMQARMSAVYYGALREPLFEDKRTRGVIYR